MRLHPIDVAVIALYLAGLLWLGWHFARKQHNTRDYFLSDREVPWWALAASIVATETSVITFISVPAFAFAPNSRGEGGDFTFLQLAAGFMLGRVVIVALFIKSYFRGELFTVYEVLDRRFGGTVRRAAASIFLVTRSLGDGVRIYATAIVLVALTGAAVKGWAGATAVIAIGLVMIVVTWMGGVSAVIWTEVAQLFLYNAGAIVAAIILLDRIPGGWPEVAAVGSATGSFNLLDFSTGLSRSYTFWSGLIGGAFLTTATHGTDQFMVQRYLCSRGPGQAARALLVSGVVVFAQFALFLTIGVMLSVYYGSSGALAPDIAASPDQVFPHFIVNELPPGAVGLVIAAIVAAAMSSSLNALASTSVSDFYRPLIAPDRTEDHYLKVSRWVTLGWGVVQVLAGLAALTMRERVVDVALSLASFTSGPMLGIFFLGALTRRVGSAGALAGIATGVVVMVLVWAGTAISWQWYAAIGALVTFGVGVVVTGFIRVNPQNPR